MAEGFEPYHVPQQSRRDKLRVAGTAMDAVGPAGLLPLYDPSLLPSDLLTCAAAAATFHHHNHPLTAVADGCKNPLNPLVKEEGPNHHYHQHHHHHVYMDQQPQSTMDLNPTAIAGMNSGGNPFLFPPPNNSLSLSLSSHGHNNNQNSRQSSLSLPLELNIQRYGSTASAGAYLIPAVAAGALAQTEAASRSSGPLGPFTGYASILKGSRFLRPAQLLLEELCDVGQGPPERIGAADSNLLVDVSAMECLSNGESSSNSNCGDAGEFRRKKSRLISMLEEVCRRYKQYYQQMQDVVASFEYVAGFGNAAPYANLALKAMSKHFRCLKNAITDQLQLNNKECGLGNPKNKDEPSRLGSKDGVQYGQRPLQGPGFFEHQPIWRPQRGLPERAVTVLRAWLFEHFLHPYPTDTDKLMLAKQTGLSRSQVSNWFINARVRLWKPMVEEIHMLETQQAQKGSQREDRSNPSTRAASDHLSNLVNSLPSETASTSNQRIHETPSKRTRNDLPDVSMRSDERHHLSYDLSRSSTHHPNTSVGEGISGMNNTVSLTLGLHQNNNGMSLSQPFQVNAVQRFGISLEGNNHEGYVLGGFEAQDRHFGRDVYGGQLWHDFVG